MMSKMYLLVTISLVPGPNTTVIQFVHMAVQKPPDSLTRGEELKHPVETNSHCQHLIEFIRLILFHSTAGLVSNTLVLIDELI